MSLKLRQSGAVMLAVLFVAVIVTSLMGYATLRMNQRLELAEESTAKLGEIAQVESKLNELTYLIATQRITAAGVSRGINASGLIRDGGLWIRPIVGDEIRTDGHVYQFGKIKFSIQNEAGLIPINSANQYWLKRWLSSNGYSSADQNQLLAVLADYLDGDNLLRPRGREESLHSPGNYLAQSCKELGRINEWRVIIEKYPDFLESCGLRRHPSLNLNDVPERLWKVLWPDSTKKLLNARSEGQWITQTNSALQYAPGLLTIPDTLHTRLGGRTFVISVVGRFASIKAIVLVGRSDFISYGRGRAI